MPPSNALPRSPGTPTRSRLRRWLVRLGAGAAGFILLALVVAATVQAVATARDRRRFPPPGQRVDLGGFKLHWQAAGSGAPTVVLDAGLGACSVAWAPVQAGVARFTRVVAYDRAGLGWSDPSPRDRTSEVLVAELRAFLERAAIPGPYVLVGHSFGGMNVRLFAARHPEIVAGLVLVDSSHEDLDARMPESLRRSEENWLRLAKWGRVVAPLGVARWLLGAPNPKVPPEWRELDRGLRLQTPQVITTCDEFVAFPRSEHQVRGIRLRPDLPLVVLSAFDPQELPPETPPEDVAAMRRTWHELQMELAGRTSNSVHLPVAHSGHLIPLEQPQAVVAGIRRVVRAVRDGTRVAVPGD